MTSLERIRDVIMTLSALTLVTLLCVVGVTSAYTGKSERSQSCPWVGLTHWLGRVWSRFFSVFGGLGWVHYSKSTKNLKGLFQRIRDFRDNCAILIDIYHTFTIMLMHFKNDQ